VKIGAHIGPEDPLAGAAARGADLVQIFLSDPQSYKPPLPRADAAALAASDVDIYVHAPYIMNPANPESRIRIPSRKTIAQTMEAAAAIGAKGVIVHGGHVGEDEDVATGFERWRKVFEYQDLPWSVPLLVENTAGGGNAVVRELANYGPLWEAIGEFNAGVVIDTCHAWAAGEDLESAVDLVRGLTGRIDLVHCNNSRDPIGSGRDRHANLGDGEIPEELLLGVVRSAGAPVVVETPDSDGSGHATDISWLRANV
jgi:deoxyribonuclease IV